MAYFFILSSNIANIRSYLHHKNEECCAINNVKTLL